MNNSLTPLVALLCLIAIGVPAGLSQDRADSTVVSSRLAAPIAASSVQEDSPLPMTYFGWGGVGTHLLNDPSVMKDLELVGDQKKRLADVRKAFNRQYKEVVKEAGKAKDDRERIDELKKEMRAIQKDQNDALSNVLLPHQLDRIKQVSNQMQLRSMGTAGALQSGMLATELDISESQKKKLLEIQQELQKEIAEVTKRLKDDAKKQVLETLSAEQRAKLEEMTGEEFNRDPSEWQGRLGKSPKSLNDLGSRKKKLKKN